MPSAEEVAAYQEAQRDLAMIAAADFAVLWEAVDSPDEAAFVAKEALPQLVQKYGLMSSLLGADFYNKLRSAAGVTGGFAAGLLDAAIEAEQARAVAGWGVGPIFEAGIDWTKSKPTAFDLLINGLFRLIQQFGRETVVAAVALDPAKPRFARVPRGKHTCAFCLMLASRGAVYWSENAAGSMNRYHGFCDCQPTPIFRGQSLPYDQELFELQYLESRDQAPSHSAKDILSQLRKDFDIS